MSQTQTRQRSHTAVEYGRQADKLSLSSIDTQSSRSERGGIAVEAKFITPLDPVIQTADGGRLPAVPVEEAHKINRLRDQVEGTEGRREPARPRGLSRFDRLQEKQSTQSLRGSREETKDISLPDKRNNEGSQDRRLDSALPPSRTHPLLPPLPLYGPPSFMRNVQCVIFRYTSFLLSTAFLAIIVLGSAFTFIPTALWYIWRLMTFRSPSIKRRFHKEEKSRAQARSTAAAKWQRRQGFKTQRSPSNGPLIETPSEEVYEPLEGGHDKLICDVRYYARRVGLDMEEYKVQTEDGFVLSLWHVYNPKEYSPAPPSQTRFLSPDVFTHDGHGARSPVRSQFKDGSRRYPVLLMHGLLQSAGAFCSNDDDSLAFFLCKSGYDVWLGNNRCGFNPQHTKLKYHDPRMWAWNIRQMGVLDLPALISRVLEETGFEKLGLVCHSQGTTETFVALAKEQRPDLGEKISVFCALAPAVYAGPLIGKMYFKFMRIISPSMFRVFFGINSFIPLMMTMHRILPGKIYGFLGYRVFSFLFNWSDERWDRGLRDRLFIFSPVYVSAESMRWWLGRECFAKHRCILATREEGQIEDVEDEEEEEKRESTQTDPAERGKTAWYNEQVPPMALWVAGSDQLVDGKRLLRRFERGREPHVQVVHQKVIDEYEHLDVLWAIDSIEQVGKEVREVLWKTMPDRDRELCRGIEGTGEARIYLDNPEDEKVEDAAEGQEL